MTKKQRRPHTPLSKRKQKGKKLEAPFNIPGNKISWSSWKDEHMPNIIWACVLAGNLDRDKYLALFRKIASRAREHLDGNKDANICHNFLSTLDVEVFLYIFQPVLEDDQARLALSALRLIESLPDHALWVSILPEIEDEQQAWNALAKGVFLSTDHQSQQATDVRWLKLIFLTIIGKLMLPANLVEEFRLYPNYGDMRKVRPTIRATEMSIRMMESGAEKPESVLQPVADKFWQELFEKTSCIPLSRNTQTVGTHEALNSELHILIEDVSEHFFYNSPTPMWMRDATLHLGLFSTV